MKVNVNGDVTMCCYQTTYLGNVLRSSIEEIWNSQLANEIRQATKENWLHWACTGWGGCPYLGKKLEPTETATFNPRMPMSLELDLPTSHCNIGGTNPNDKNPACIMCPRNAKKVQETEIIMLDQTELIVEKLKPLVPYIKTFSVLGVAEPFWKDLLFKIFDQMDFRNHKNHIFFWTYTNGSCCSEERMKRFLDYTNSSLIQVSVDAATPETYVKIRRRNFFDLIKKNLIAYNKMRGPGHILKICNNINTINVHEMPMMVEYAKEVGADCILFNPTHDAGIVAEIRPYLVTKHNLLRFVKYRNLAEEKAKEIGIKFEMLREFEQIVGVPTELVQLKLS
jgi:MoaA/NifB/PqqE/SkfB family radical SAM enzyme